MQPIVAKLEKRREADTQYDTARIHSSLLESATYVRLFELLHRKGELTGVDRAVSDSGKHCCTSIIIVEVGIVILVVVDAALRIHFFIF